MMRREPPELAALKSALGAQLAAARRAAEVGQQQVGRKTGYSRSSVAHAEAGRQLLSREFWQTADDLLKADGALLAEYQRVHAAKQDHERRSRKPSLPRRTLRLKRCTPRPPRTSPRTLIRWPCRPERRLWPALPRLLVRHCWQRA